MTAPVRVDATARSLDASHKLHAALGAQFRKRRGIAVEGALATSAAPPPWSAEFYGLDRAEAFRSASDAEREAILEAAAQNLLSEAYGVERLGMASAAKAILLAETIEERQAYSLIGADEATHLFAIAPYVKAPDVAGTGPFFDLLHGAIADLSRDALVFVLQSVLEGWGLGHYRALAESCRDPALTAVLRQILADEAFHVGTGNVVFDPARLGERDVAAMIEVLARLLGMVAMGPQSVVAAVERARGGLSLRARTRLFADLESERTSARRLSVLHDLVSAFPVVERRLVGLGAFVPQPPEVCAGVFASASSTSTT